MPSDKYEFRNDSGETIPAYGIIRVTNVLEITSRRMVLKAEKPDDYGGTTMHFVNSARSVASGDFGVCSAAAVPVWAKYDGSANPETEAFGPVDDSWELKEGVPGFRVLGTGNGGLALVMREAPTKIVVELDEDLDEGSTASASPYYFNGASWVDNSAYTVTVREGLGIGSSITSETRLWCEWEPTSKQWVATSGEC